MFIGAMPKCLKAPEGRHVYSTGDAQNTFREGRMFIEDNKKASRESSARYTGKREDGKEGSSLLPPLACGGIQGGRQPIKKLCTIALFCQGFTIRCCFSVSISCASVSTCLSSERSFPLRHAMMAVGIPIVATIRGIRT